MNTDMKTNALATAPRVTNEGHEAEETRPWYRANLGGDDRFEPGPGHVQPPLFARASVSGRRIENANDAAEEALYFLGTELGKALVRNADIQRVRGCIHIAGDRYLVSTEDPNAPLLKAMFVLPAWDFIVDPRVGRVVAVQERSFRESLFGSLEPEPVGRY